MGGPRQKRIILQFLALVIVTVFSLSACRQEVQPTSESSLDSIGMETSEFTMSMDESSTSEAEASESASVASEHTSTSEQEQTVEESEDSTEAETNEVSQTTTTESTSESTTTSQTSVSETSEVKKNTSRTAEATKTKQTSTSLAKTTLVASTTTTVTPTPMPTTTRATTSTQRTTTTTTQAPTTTTTEAIKSIQVSIDVQSLLAVLDQIENQAVKNSIPSNGILLSPIEISFQEGDTALSALEKSIAGTMPIEVQRSFLGAYVSSINNIPEKLVGGIAGWTYEVNGQQINQSADSYLLKPGDRLVWKYITA